MRRPEQPDLSRALPRALPAFFLLLAIGLSTLAPNADASGLAVLFKGGLKIDIDGAPDAYHPDEELFPAIDRLCHAGVAYPADGEPFRGVRDCDGFKEIYRLARESGWRDEGAGRILWYGVASDPKSEGYVPCIQKHGAFKGYFVSATSLRDPRRSPCSQEAYLNSRRTPYVVMNSGAARRLGLALGDYGVALDTRSGNIAPVLLGDFGRDEGEASLATAAILNGRDPAHARRVKSRSKIFKLGSLRPVIAYLLFPGTSQGFESDPDVIATRAFAHFEAWGGNDRLERELEGYEAGRKKHLVITKDVCPLASTQRSAPRSPGLRLTELDVRQDIPEAPRFIGFHAAPRLALPMP